MSQWGNIDYANNAPKFLDTNHPGNTDVYLVSSSRLANATFGSGKAVAHQGWVKIKQGTGPITSISVDGGPRTYTNTYLTIAGANTTPANASLLVLGTNTVSVVLRSGGTGFASAPTITANGANNSTLTFTATMGGRAGRVQAETIVALSETTITDANSGLPYFTGV